MLPFTHLSLQLLLCTVSERDQIHAEMFGFFSPFADQISLQWVPVGGISVKLSSPGAGQPFLQGPRSLIWFQQTGWDDGHASQCLWFSFSFFFKSISPCFHTALLISDRPHCVPLLKERLENVLFVMWSPRWGWQRGGQTSPPSIVYGDSCGSPLWSSSSPEAQMTLLSFFFFFKGRGQGIIHI